MATYEQRLERAKEVVRHADHILVGGGAGLSDAAGLKYGGRRFADNFAPFIAKYGLTDMYSSAFHPFEAEEERWAYWAKHIAINRHDPPALKLYLDLLELVQRSAYFVVTTNADHQFHKAGFPADRVFAVQGDYGLLQCAAACHDRLYENEELVRALVEQTVDCRIPATLVPRCPECGGPMDPNLRKNGRFVEDVEWEAAARRYSAFLQEALRSGFVLLELGVGFNTPGIIRFPFERMVLGSRHVVLIRVNAQDAGGPREIADRTILFPEDMTRVVEDLLGPA
jgi:NAD-dependent SIR2 family protein deacetylase